MRTGQKRTRCPLKGCYAQDFRIFSLSLCQLKPVVAQNSDGTLTVPLEVPLSLPHPNASAPQLFPNNRRGVTVTFLLLSSLHGEADCEDTQYTFTIGSVEKKCFSRD